MLKINRSKAKLALTHARVGLFLWGLALLLILGLLLGRAFAPHLVADLWLSAFVSVPVTLICMGIFSVLYEYSTRTTFDAYMRSVYSAWKTGVTVFPTHKREEIPDRREVLLRARRHVCLMSTTFSRYFAAVDELVREKLDATVSFRFIVYDPDSPAILEKANEEEYKPDDFTDEIRAMCRRYFGPLTRKYPGLITVKFCPFNVPFAITIIDDREIVVSLNIYGLSRSRRETPCLLIANTYEEDSVFRLYESSFEAIWRKLPSSIPASVKRFFDGPGPSGTVTAGEAQSLDTTA